MVNVNFRITGCDSGEPIAGVKVALDGLGGDGGNEIAGLTDSSGMVALELYPHQFFVNLNPPENSPYQYTAFADNPNLGPTDHPWLEVTEQMTEVVEYCMDRR